MSMTKTHSSQKYVFRIWQCWSTCFFLQNLLLAQKRLNVIKSTKMRVGIIFTQRHISIPKLNTVSSYWQQEKTVFNQQKYKNTIIFILVWKYAFFFNINICRLHKYFCGFYVLDFMWIYVSDLMWIYVLDFLWMYVLFFFLWMHVLDFLGMYILDFMFWIFCGCMFWIFCGCMFWMYLNKVSRGRGSRAKRWKFSTFGKRKWKWKWWWNILCIKKDKRGIALTKSKHFRALRWKLSTFVGGESESDYK